MDSGIGARRRPGDRGQGTSGVGASGGHFNEEEVTVLTGPKTAGIGLFFFKIQYYIIM